MELHSPEPDNTANRQASSSTFTPPPASVEDALLEAASAWLVLLEPVQPLVDAAVNALIADQYTDALAQLAGCTRETARREAPDLWPKVVEEMGLTILTPIQSNIYAARAVVRDLLKADKTPAEITTRLNKLFHDNTQPPLCWFQNPEPHADPLPRLFEAF